MLRVAREVRIFPLLTLMLEVSPHLNRLADELQMLGCRVEFKRVAYELQRGGDMMMTITRPGA
jgi:hypothetical protein